MDNHRRQNCHRAADPLPCPVPGLPTLASQRAEMRAATMRAKNRRRLAKGAHGR